MSVPAELIARARRTIFPAERGPDWAVAVAADARLTGGLPRNDIPPLAKGPSQALDQFQAKYCIPKHGAAKHDVMACLQTAYYERLARDEQALARLAAQRGEYGTPVQLMTGNSSMSAMVLQNAASRKAVPGGVPVAPPVSGRGAPTGEKPSCPPTEPHPSPKKTGGEA